jgi:hypothetical protein
MPSNAEVDTRLDQAISDNQDVKEEFNRRAFEELSRFFVDEVLVKTDKNLLAMFRAKMR